MRKRFSLVLFLLGSLVITACGSGWTRIDPKTETVSIHYSDSSAARLRLEIGVGNLKVSPGGDNLVEGSITYNVQEWAPQTTVNANSVTLRQGTTSGVGNLSGLNNAQNDWRLLLGTAKPYELTVSNGVANANLALGGLPLNFVSIEGGVGEVFVGFDKSNPQTASTLTFKTGVGRLQAAGLLNANAQSMSVESGAGDVQLDFTGDTLKQDLVVKVKTGVGALTANFKKGIPVRVVARQGLGRVKGQGGDFTLTDNDIYATAGFDTASGPRIIMDVETGVGEVRLNTIANAQ